MEVISINDPQAQDRTIEVLRSGGIVVLPTDTVYGIGCDALNKATQEKIFLIKKRPQDKAIAWLVSDREMLSQTVYFEDALAPKLFQVWPGPFTAVFHTHDNDATIGVRIPDYPFVQNLIHAFGRPLAVTSANLSSRPPRTSVRDVIADFEEQGGIDLIIDGGDLPGNMASTVIDFTQSPPRVVRDGKIPAEQLETIFHMKFSRNQ